MKNSLDAKLTLWLGFISFFFIVLLKIKFNGNADDLFSSVSQAVLAATLLRFGFVKWAWKWRPFAWTERFHKTPLLEGSWTGTYQSNGNEKTPQDKLTGKAEVTIFQPDIHTIKIMRESDESISKSISEDITVDDGHYFLTYTYLNEPNATVKGRSSISYGAARLKMKRKDQANLEGNYWTDQHTTGFLSIKKVT
jgi:hypothetical protein